MVLSIENLVYLFGIAKTLSSFFFVPFFPAHLPLLSLSLLFSTPLSLLFSTPLSIPAPFPFFPPIVQPLPPFPPIPCPSPSLLPPCALLLTIPPIPSLVSSPTAPFAHSAFSSPLRFSHTPQIPAMSFWGRRQRSNPLATTVAYLSTEVSEE